MTIALGAFSTSTKTGAAVVSITSNVISTNISGSGFFVGVLQSNTTPGAVTITDSKGNAYTHLGSQVALGSGHKTLDRFYCQNGTGSATHTVTAAVTAPGVANWDLFFGEIIGGSLTALYDSSSANGGFQAAPHATGNVTVTTANAAIGELLITCFGSDSFNPATVTVANGFTVVSATYAGTVAAIVGGWAYKLISVAGSYGASWTEGGTTFVAVSLDGFVGPSSIPSQFKIYANGAIQAHAFVQSALPSGMAMRFYAANNTVHVANLNINGVGTIKLNANGQLSVNSTITV